ncbi:MAG: hypothetical protein U1E73_08470 [Planctomycetota bacterium]
MQGLYALLSLCLPFTALLAQANTIPGLDLQLLDTWAIAAFQRAGSYPAGKSAIGVITTCCNPGSVAVPFQAAMNPDHGFIHYIVAREADGRLEQISDWSYIKHTFGSSNNNSTCGPCAGQGNSSYVEVGCSDTYGNYQAVDHFNMGPPEELDPWLGTWVPQCSYFDQGDPPVAPNQTCDGIRSLTHAQASVLNLGVHHQVQVRDQDLLTPGARWYWQAGYIVPSEADAERDNNLGSREFFPTWNGSGFDMGDGPAMLQGTILQRWNGAAISSASNGNDDGRFYVAVKVTGPANGVYHYEYAVHNRDNGRGMAAFHVPMCGSARAWNFGFHDVDQDPLDDWIAQQIGNEVVWSTGSNPQRWNTLFNFWFDSDAAPVPGGSLVLDQAAIGPGALSVSVLSVAPMGLYAQYLGSGCGAVTPPVLFADGRATIGNSGFVLRSAGNPAGVACGFVLTTTPGTTLLGGACSLYSASWTGYLAPFMTIADAAGGGAMPLAIPNSPAFEGIDLDFQAANIHAGGAFLGAFDLSNGLRVRVGSLIAGCP